MKSTLRLFLLGVFACSAACVVAGCAVAKPATRHLAFPGQTEGALVTRASRSLAVAGYEIKSQDASTGVIQAFRPMTGAFSRPGYGHRVVIETKDGGVKITAFPMEGVVGGESPEQIAGEVARALGGN